MINLLAAVVGAVLATNQPGAVSNLVHETREVSVMLTNTTDPVELEFKRLLEEDDTAQAEVDGWIQDNEKFAAKGAGEPKAELNRRIMARFATVRESYEAFLTQHTNHARAHLAYAGFLQDIGEEHEAAPHLEKSAGLDPKNPAVWNNLANYYGHYGDVKRAFEFYPRAIALNTNEPVYYHNFGTTVYLFRKDAKEFFELNEQQVFDKALGLYESARKLSPDDFLLAQDIAQSYYGIRPLRTNAAFAAWTNALVLARDDIERQGAQVHLARLNWMVGQTNQAAGLLHGITHEMYADIKAKITSNLTNAPPDVSQPFGASPPRAAVESKPD